MQFERNEISAIYRQCEECGLIFLDRVASIIDSYLDPLEYHHENHQNTTSCDIVFGLEKRKNFVYRFKKSGKLLDIGCGTGRFIFYLTKTAKKDWKAIGVEPDITSTNFGKEKYGVEIINDKFEDIHLDEKFDVITLWDVIEHVENPELLLKKAYSLLNEQGIMIIRTPNYESLDAKLFAECWAGFDAPRHNFVFGKSLLVNLLKNHDFNIVYTTTKIGGYQNFLKSLSFYISKKVNSPILKKMILRMINSIFIKSVGYIVYNLFFSGQMGGEITICAQKRIYLP